MNQKNHTSIGFRCQALTSRDPLPMPLDQLSKLLERLPPLPPRDGHDRPTAQTGAKGVYATQRLEDKLTAHKQYINKYGQDMPEIRDWSWSPTD